ncbi:MAG: ferrous iron transporter B [Clostridiales bacterium]|nr:ferrous iron transporter B [Clostridiales bacterium]
MLKILSRAKAESSAKTLNVVLAGNPNAGKTTLFNSLTKSRLKTGNYHGVTTSPASKTVGGVTYTDVPGMYSFNSYTMEEDSAQEACKAADIIINVVDATTLENSLNLTRRLIALNKNTVVYVTKLDLLRRRGGRLDAEKLAQILGVPVLVCQAKQLKKAVEEGSFAKPVKSPEIQFAEAYYGGNGAISRAEKLFYNKFFALLFFVTSLTFTFFITFHPYMIGSLLKDLTEELICEKFGGAVGSAISNPLLSSFVAEGIIGGVGGVLSFIPQITILYLVLILLDESGVSSALTFVTDGLFEKAGLSGRAAFSLISGFGCTAAAIATTRGFSEEGARRKTIAVLPFIPCGAKMPVFLTFLSPLFKNPFPAVCALYFGGVSLAIVVSAIIKGKGEGLISEVTPVSFPPLSTTAKKLYFQVKSFIIKVTTYVFAFCTVSWLLSHVSFTQGFCAPEESILGVISRAISYLFYPMGVKDWRIAYAALTGFAAKENVAATVAMLIPEGLSLSWGASFALCTFFLCCPACISAFGASVKEIGFKRTLLYNLAQLVFAFVMAYATNFLIDMSALATILMFT